MKFKIEVETVDGQKWWEGYDVDTTNPQEWAEGTIAMFNGTLRPGEQSRTLLQVKTLEEDNGKFHQWTKLATGMSQSFRGQVIDKMYCTECGVTGKRFGLCPEVKIDSKYKKKIYQRCDTAKGNVGR